VRSFIRPTRVQREQLQQYFEKMNQAGRV